jgi:collagen type III alpha
MCLLLCVCVSCQGGATRFDLLDLKVQPQRGKALLFFPAFSGGKSDGR